MLSRGSLSRARWSAWRVMNHGVLPSQMRTLPTGSASVISRTAGAGANGHRASRCIGYSGAWPGGAVVSDMTACKQDRLTRPGRQPDRSLTWRGSHLGQVAEPVAEPAPGVDQRRPLPVDLVPQPRQEALDGVGAPRLAPHLPGELIL